MLFRSNSAIYESPVTGIPLPEIEEDEFDKSSSSSGPNIALQSENSYLTLNHSNDSYQTITSDELATLLKEYTFLDHKYDQVSILDGRFEYEFKGGRIAGAQNICTRSAIPIVYNSFKGGNMCIVFHCEFSQNRGPTLMKLFRQYDRKQNIKDYPKLKFPNLFLLKGGYKQFYTDHPEFCIGGYVPMREQKYVSSGQLKRCHSYYTKNMLLSAEEMNNHSFTYKKQFPAISASQFSSCSQSTTLSKRSISLPAILTCSQPLTFPSMYIDETTDCSCASSNSISPVSVPPHFTFSHQASLSPSHTPFYADPNITDSFNSTDHDALKASRFVNFP